MSFNPCVNVAIENSHMSQMKFDHKHLGKGSTNFEIPFDWTDMPVKANI